MHDCWSLQFKKYIYMLPRPLPLPSPYPIIYKEVGISKNLLDFQDQGFL